jgi:CHAT domain-containing protein/Tfp pilus assembly protein PilF
MLGESEQALKYLQLSVEEVERPQEDKSAKEFGVAYTALGAFYLGSGEKEKALEYLHRAIPYWRSPAGNSAGTPDVNGEARVLLRLGQLYASLGETDKAIDCLRQAASTWRATSDPVWLVRALNSLGQTQFDLGDLYDALASFNEALQVSRKSGSKENQAYALANLGQVKLSLGAYDEAFNYLQQALSLMETIGNRGGHAYVLSKLGLLARAQGKPRDALGYFARALPLREAVRDREGTAQAFYQLALTQRDLGDLETARGNIERALGLIEFVRASFSGKEMRSAYLSSARSYYEFYVDLLMRLHERNPPAGYDAKAFEASEHARARSLLETLSAGGLDIREGVPPGLLLRERSIEQRLTGKSEYQTRLLSSSATNQQIEAAAKEVDALADDYREIQAQIRAASPRYAALTQPEPLMLKEIQSQVLDADTVLLEYALGEERSFLWLVTRDSISAFQLPKLTEIENLARRLYLNLSAPTASKQAKGSASARRLDGTNEGGETLSQMLLGPVRDRLGNKRLLIVAEGTLQYIPFVALPVPKAHLARASLSDKKKERYQPLAARHEIVSLPSASSLVLLRREIGSRPSPPKTLAAFADPVFETNDPRVRHNARIASAPPAVDKERTPAIEGSRTLTAINFDLSLRDSGAATNGIIPRLPSTRREALAIANLVPAQQRKLALDFDASRATALSGALSQYRILHFATHGLLDSQRPELSGLVLSLVDKNGRRQDGFLQVHEIYNLKLPADLVVLSACRTALGKDVKGEGLLGVTRGFMYAGAARVVSSLWEVDSRATAELMTRFYREMLMNKLSPAAALRAAQISMSHDAHWHSPYYWAGFVIQGEYR